MTIALDAASVECGGTVTGTVEWSGAGPAELSLRWATSGDGTTDTATTGQVQLTGGQAEFGLAVPHDGPMTFDGSLVSVRWQLVLIAGDTTETAEVTVLPRGGLTVWVRNAAPPPQT